MVAGFAGTGSSLLAQETAARGFRNPSLDPVAQRNIEDWTFQQRGVPDDWSHHHLVFSNPGREEDAAQSGKYEHWLHTVNESRFVLQQIQRSRSAQARTGANTSGAFRRANPWYSGAPPSSTDSAARKDWNVAIGGVAASATGTVSSNGATGTSTVTVDGQTLTASSPAAATATGTFAGSPSPSQTVTITNPAGPNTLTLTTNATLASALGTMSAAPTSNTSPTITVTNSAGSGSNTLSLSNNGTGATATGIFSGAGPGAGQTITIKSGSNTLTLTFSAAAATPGTGTVTVSNAFGSANGDTVTIGSVVYTFEESTSAFSGSPFTGSQYYCQDTTSPCVWWGTTATNQAQALFAAITNNPAACPTVAQGLYGNWQHTCYSYISTPNPNVTASYSYPSASISLINTTGSSAPFLTSSSQSAFTLTSTSGSTIPGFTSGSGACTSSTAGTLNVSATPDTVASYLAAAINSCDISYPAVGVTAIESTGGIVTITDTTPGSYTTLSALGGTASHFVWSSVTPGTAGSNGCTSATTGTFATDSSTATVASNIAAAINACNSAYPAVGVTASYSSGNTFTVVNPVPGPFLAVGASNNTGLFTWGAVTGGSLGTNSCPSSTSGTFATSSNTTTLASNLATAINACPAAVGVTATASGPSVTVAARNTGTSGNNIALAETLSNFSWSGSALSGGSDGTNSATTFAYLSGGVPVSPTQLAANIAAAIDANPTLQAVLSAASNGNVVTVSANTPGTSGNSYAVSANLSGFAWSGGHFAGGVAGARVQPNMYPAKYSFDSTSASCTDFVVYPTGTAGAAGAASIVAFDNVYEGGCSGTVPSAYWGYNTGGMVTTSPVLALDGSQVAFVQVSGTTASLVLLKWSPNSGTPTLPVTLASVTPAAYRSCTAPCMVTLPFSGGHSDTFSAPYYDYSGDIAYVGDDSGYLHKFTGVFAGTPAEVTTAWPVHLGSNQLSSPVYDSGTGNVFVGDMGGVLYSVTAATGAIYGTTGSVGDAMIDGPLVDSSAGAVYAFITTGVAPYASGRNAVLELPTNFTSLNSPSAAVFQSIGTGGSGYYLYAGTFDNVYYSAATPTGNLYVVGNTGTSGGATLYRIPVSNSVMGTPVSAVSGLNRSTRGFPSPVTEFCNNGGSDCSASSTTTTAGMDYIFFSVNRGNVSGCNNTAGHGCILSYNVSDPSNIQMAGTGLDVTTPGTNGCWATGGLVIDNSAGMAGASQIYFVGLGTNAAGGPTGTTQTSTRCSTGAATTMGATQTSQANP